MISASLFSDKWPIVKLGDVVNFLDHKRVPVTKADRTPGDYQYYGANGSQGTINDYIFDEPLVLLAEDGGNFGHETRSIAYIARGKYWVNNHAHVLQPKECIDLEYLFRVLARYDVTPFIKGATRAKLSKTDASRIPIPLPPLETQKKIAAVLEKADQLRKDCQQMEQELNSLAQSVFIDMFGDPVTNPKGWDVRAIGTTFGLLTDYHANGSYEILQENVSLLNEGYALMVRTTDLEKNNFTDGVNYISEHAYNFLTKTKVYGNELIVNKIGSAGKVYLMPVLNRPVSLAMNQFMIRFDEEAANSVFMYYLLTSKGGSQAIQKKVKGAVTKTIRKDALREIELPIPPKHKQDEFSKFIEQHRKLIDDQNLLKEQYEQSFNGLMKKAFKGELNL